MKIGRFTILQALGQGGMGSVYAAYDDKLDRKVAIKLLHDHVRDESQGRARMQREAQALARLSHPNVVQIYDFGVHEGRVYVAMEYVRGQTLRAWAREHREDWRRFVDLMIQAGRGLAAAHRVGIIHRDFKPDNVLVGDDGRVRVVDFGLARAKAKVTRASHPGADELDDTASDADRTLGSLDEEVTHEGMLVGTPAYMAPEQIMDGRFDTHSDQYSFCVVLFEGLYGRRPFLEKRLPQLARDMFAERIPGPPAGSTIPGRLHGVVRRGLAADPQRRYPSLDVLLAELDPEPRVSRLGRVTGLGVVALVGAGVVVGARFGVASEPACSGSEQALARVWGDESRDALEAAIVEAAPSYGAELFASLEPRITAYATAWTEMHGDACRAHLRGEQSSDALDLRMSCLQRRRGELAAVVEILREPDEETLEHAASAVGRLGRLDRCADLDALRRPVDPPAPGETAAAVEAAYAQLDRVQTLDHFGRFEDGSRLVSQIVADARELAYAPLLAAALVWQGLLAVEQTKYGDAITALREAYTLAETARDDEVRLRVATAMTVVVAHTDPNEKRLADWGRIGFALLDRLGVRDGPAHAWLLTNLGESYLAVDGHDDEAAVHLEQAIALLARVYDPDHVSLIEPLNDLAMIRSRGKQYAESRALYERALATAASSLGRAHPHNGYIHNNLAMALEKQGDLDGAREHYEASVRIWTPTMGGEHFLTSYPLANLAGVLLRLGELDQAREMAEQALAIRAARARGKPSKPQLKPLRTLGELALERGELDAARGYLDRAIELAEQTYGPGHRKLITPLRLRARLARALDEPEHAARLLERARPLASTPRVRAEVLFELARSHGRVDPRGERGRALAAAALKELRAGEPRDDALADQITTWLNELAPAGP